MMVDPASLAATALAVATPYLIDLSKEAGKSVASGAGKSIWDWIKTKLNSPAGQEVVADMTKAPNDSDNAKAVEIALTKLIKSEPSLSASLAKLLHNEGVSLANQNVNSVGDNNKIGQASGDSCTVTIS